MALSSKEMRRTEVMYGNGAVYVTDGKRVYEFLGANFNVEPLNRFGGLAFDIQDEIVVSFGSGTTKAGALRAIDLLKNRLKEIPEAQFNPSEEGSDAASNRRAGTNYWPVKPQR